MRAFLCPYLLGEKSIILITSEWMEKAMAPHSSTLAWKIPWTEGPGGLQSMGLLGVRHDWATSLSLFTFMHWRRKPLQCSCLENPRDRGAWWAAVYGVAQSRTRLKRLSSSSREKAHFRGRKKPKRNYYNRKTTVPADKLGTSTWREVCYWY